MLVTVFCSLSIFGADIYNVECWGTIVGTSSNTWVRLQFQKINTNTFAYKGTFEGSSVIGVNYMRYYFKTDAESISNFSITINEHNSGLSNLSNWGAYSIYICELNSAGNAIVARHNIQDKTEYKPVYNGSFWSISWDYIGDSFTGSVIEVGLRTSSYNLDATYWKQFTVEEFSVNGVSGVFTNGEQAIIDNLKSINGILGADVGEVSQFDPSVDITQSYTDASHAFQNDVDTFSGFINQYNMRTTSERVMFPALLTLSTAGGDLTIILGVCIAACSAGSLIFALRRLHG